jgi:hypothetical protein
MARIRTVKPEFWVSEQIAECSPNARLTFIGLWNFCDDNGVHPAKPKTLKAELYPMDDFSAADVAGWMRELVGAGLVVEYEVDGELFWHVTGWAKHQKIDRPSAKYPVPPALSDSTTTRRAALPSDRETFDESSPNARPAPPPGMEGNGKEGNGDDGDSPDARPDAAASRRPVASQDATSGSALTVEQLRAEGLPDDVAAEFLALRKRKRAPLTRLAWSGIRAEAEKAGWSTEQAIRKALARGWQSFEAKWVRDEPQPGAARQQPALLHADDDLAELSR